jgi:hypothetical protein
MRTATPFTIENRFAKVSIGHHTHQGIEILVGEDADDNKGYLLLLEVIAVECDSAAKQTIGRGKAQRNFHQIGTMTGRLSPVTIPASAAGPLVLQC